MKVPRAIIGPIMAYPRRPASEAPLVRQAAAKLKYPSARLKAGHIAKRVAAEAVAYVDADPMEQRLTDLGAVFSPPCPIQALASYAVDLVCQRRKARFEAAGFRRVSEVEWNAETKSIQSEVERVLAERYRRLII